MLKSYDFGFSSKAKSKSKSLRSSVLNKYDPTIEDYEYDEPPELGVAMAEVR